MRNLRLLLEYDGTEYLGWQVQAHGRTVQGELERAIEQVTGARPTLYGAGRTDAGVHARGQVASFYTASALDCGRMQRALAAITSPDLSVRAVDEVPWEFHARRSAIGKAYSYTLQWGWPRPALDRHRVAGVWGRLDVEAMAAAARGLVGTHDFAAFQGTGSPRRSTVRTLARCELVREDPLGAPNRGTVHLEADGFLYKMCRSIVGTLVEVGRGALAADDVAALVDPARGGKAPFTAPACGLVLERVDYPPAYRSPVSAEAVGGTIPP